MGRRSDEKQWVLGKRASATALDVAGKLMKRETVADLHYRGVRLEAAVVDVAPCQEPLGSTLLRYFVLRPTVWPMEPVPFGVGVPSEWRSEVLVLPRQDARNLMTGLAPLEAEFAVRGFLRRVEHEIDFILKRHRTSRSRR